LFKAELIVPRGPWRSVEQVEIAMLERIDWYNHRAVFSGGVPSCRVMLRRGDT